MLPYSESKYMYVHECFECLSESVASRSFRSRPCSRSCFSGVLRAPGEEALLKEVALIE